MKHKLAGVLLAGLAVFSLFSQTALGFDLNRLSDDEIRQVETILSKVDPMIQSKRNSGDIATLTFAELGAPLDESEREFLQWFQQFDPVKAGIKTTWQGLSYGYPDLVRVEGQEIKRSEGVEIIPPQFVPAPVYKAYLQMMVAMRAELGKALLIESAYRSSAYQLYLFLFYLKNHDYSILETAEWNAFPGYSEHGNPEKQALDFINEEGINGEDNPEDFEKLPEFAWLEKHAHEYGFILSYPRNSPVGIAYEPWHWHYRGIETANS